MVNARTFARRCMLMSPSMALPNAGVPAGALTSTFVPLQSASSWVPPGPFRYSCLFSSHCHSRSPPLLPRSPVHKRRTQYSSRVASFRFRLLTRVLRLVGMCRCRRHDAVFVDAPLVDFSISYAQNTGSHIMLGFSGPQAAISPTMQSSGVQSAADLSGSSENTVSESGDAKINKKALVEVKCGGRGQSDDWVTSASMPLKW